MTGYKRALRARREGTVTPRGRDLEEKEGRNRLREEGTGYGKREEPCKATAARRSPENPAQRKREGCGGEQPRDRNPGNSPGGRMSQGQWQLLNDFRRERDLTRFVFKEARTAGGVGKGGRD